LELIHAYSLERLTQINEPQGTPTTRLIKGTGLVASGMASGVLNGDATGLRFSANYNTVYMDFTDAIDASRTESYWVTTGWLIGCDAVAAGNWTTAIFGIEAVGVIAPSQIFPLTNYQPAYLEIALNPITAVYRVYVNGSKIVEGNWDKTKRLIRLMYGPGFGYYYTMKDLYVGRFNGDEEPRLRRWKSVTLPAVTNGIGTPAVLQTVDGASATVTAVETTNTYNIPAKTLGIAVQSSMLTPDGLSDLVTTLKDGTLTKTSRSSNLSNQLVNTSPRVGQGIGVGTIAPTAGATTLTVGVKAVDRA
jgi:hypothetical protein